MPTLRTETDVGLGRGLRLRLHLQVGLTGFRAALARTKAPLERGTADLRPRLAEASKPALPAPAPTAEPDAPTAEPDAPTAEPDAPTAERDVPTADAAELRRRLAARNRQVGRMREELAAKDAVAKALRARASGEANGAPPAGIRPESLIWLFGVPRTGSTWLSAMMGDLEGHTEWPEPYVGDVFGYAYYNRAWDWMRARGDYVLGDEYRDVWLRSIRTFVLDGANARYPQVADGGYLVIKEPNGSIGAPLLAGALPESRIVLMLRDPRDVVASLLAASRKGSWTAGIGAQLSVADSDPDEFVRQRARLYMVSMQRAREAYDAHDGPKVMTKYETLRYEPFEELKAIHAGVGVPVADDDLRRVVEKHDWENVPAELKGADKPRRKARPGGYEEDLSPTQIETVEEVAAPILTEFYAR